MKTEIVLLDFGCGCKIDASNKETSGKWAGWSAPLVPCADHKGKGPSTGLTIEYRQSAVRAYRAVWPKGVR